MFRFVTRRRRALFALCVGVLLLFFTSAPFLPHAHAADFNYETAVDYRVDESGITHVAERFRITNNTARLYLQSLQLTTPTDEANNLRVFYADGTAIPFTKKLTSTNVEGYSYKYVEVDISFNRSNAGAGSVWSFEVDYDTSKLVENKGSARTVFIPAIGENSLTNNYSIRLLVPDNFGKARGIGSTPNFAGIEDGRQVYSIPRKDLLKQSAVLAFGDSTIYNVNFRFPLKNSSAREQVITATLPPDTPVQKIYINSLSPKPIATRLDEDGNVLADWKVPAHTTLVVNTDIDALISYKKYNLDGGGSMSDLPTDIVKSYTEPTRYWQSGDSRIVDQAQKAVASSSGSVVARIKALNQFVIDTLSYNNEKIKYNIRQGAVNALLRPDNAVCLEYSDLLIGLLRSQGIPARMPVGYAYSGNLKTTPAVSDSLHSWVEAYVPNVGWIEVDPTWGEKFDGFGASDLDHFTFAMWGKQDGVPTAVMAHGTDQNYQYENTTISFRSVKPIAATTGQLTAKKYVIAPFFSLVFYRAVAPANVAGNNYEVEISNSKRFYKQELGSLAPGQIFRGVLDVAGNLYAAHMTGRLYQNEEGARILATTPVDVSYLPMVILIVLISGIILIIMVKSVLKRARRNRIAPLEASRRHKKKIAKNFRRQIKKIHY